MRRNTGTYHDKKRLSLSSLPNMIFTLMICSFCWYVGYYLWIGFPVGSNTNTTYLWNYLCGFLTVRNYVYFTGFAILVLSATLIQQFNFRFVIIRGKTTLPFLIFLLLNSVNPNFYPFRPISIALLLMLVAMFELFGSYQNQSAIGRMFNMLFFMGLGSLIWPQLLWFIPVFLFGMYQFRIWNTRTFSASLLGLFTVFWFVAGWCVWKNDFSVFSNIFRCIADIQLIFLKESWLTEWPELICITILAIVMVIHYSIPEPESTIRSRHFLSFLMMLGILSFILSLFYASNLTDCVIMFYMPASLSVSYFFSGKYGFRSFLFYYLFIVVLIILLIVHLWNFL